ncbi:Detected protein of confused Function [Hibiscus syriacus]|uniref:Detected protein of confused Function n=1 Tax=Hibiscus syriacus TaxID=106335 RepID=A0A6A3A560_HIBSY|nr:Detected protein of confused Function [Hibiscus syriacus]
MTRRREGISAQRASVENASVLSPSSRQGGEVFLLPEFNDLVKEFDTSRTFITAKKDDHEQEIKHLRNMVRTLRERERNLEVQLLEYYGLKEREAAVLELENQLKMNNMEAKLFTLKIASLQIKVLKKKLRHEVEQNREQIRNVLKRVASLKEQELKARADYHDIEPKLERLKVLEGEAEELRKYNTRFQIEISEQARKFESTQIFANSVLEDPERLRQENEDLKKQIDQLNEDRCADAENWCIAVARDLSKSPSPESEKKAKKLIVEYARAEGTGDSMDFDSGHWSCSRAFYGSDNHEVADSRIGNSSAEEIPTSRRNKFFKKLRRLTVGTYVSTSSRKSDNTEDVDSLSWSSGRGNERLQNSSDRFTTPSQISPATTLDVDKVKEIGKFRRNSHCGSYGYKGFSCGRDESLFKPQLDQGSYSHRRLDVMKFAEALKQPGTDSGQIHKSRKHHLIFSFTQ